MTINDGLVVKKRGSFKEDAGASGHPIIVILHDDEYIWGAICTDAANSDKFSSTIALNWSYCGLKKATVAICDKLRQFNVCDINHIYGSLSNDDLSAIIAELDSCNALDDLKEHFSEYNWEVDNNVKKNF